MTPCSLDSQFVCCCFSWIWFSSNLSSKSRFLFFLFVNWALYSINCYITKTIQINLIISSLIEEFSFGFPLSLAPIFVVPIFFFFLLSNFLHSDIKFQQQLILSMKILTFWSPGMMCLSFWLFGWCPDWLLSHKTRLS